MNGGSERAGGDDEKRGEEIERGKGGPRVLFVMNLVLSTVSMATVVYDLSHINLTTFSVVNIASATLVLMAVTYLVTS